MEKETQKTQLPQPIVSTSLLSCKFCNGFAFHQIDKGEWNLKTGWKFKVWICTECLIKKNQHLISYHPTESIMYIGSLSIEDKVRMCNEC